MYREVGKISFNSRREEEKGRGRGGWSEMEGRGERWRKAGTQMNVPHHLTVCCDRAVFRVLWVVESDRLWLALLMMSALLAMAGSGLLGHL
ncbi:hypothetical protein LSAT2_000452, partial [Lamellibrachia satsuma]